MCSSRDTPCALFVVGLCGYWLRAWFGADFGCGFLGADFGADFSTAEQFQVQVCLVTERAIS